MTNKEQEFVPVRKWSELQELVKTPNQVVKIRFPEVETPRLQEPTIGAFVNHNKHGYDERCPSTNNWLVQTTQDTTLKISTLASTGYQFDEDGTITLIAFSTSERTHQSKQFEQNKSYLQRLGIWREG